MKFKPLISLTIILLTGFLLIYYLVNHLYDFKQLFEIGLSNMGWVVVLALIFIFSIFTNGLVLDTLMRPFGIKLKRKESFGLAIVTSFYNMITPFRGGMAARAVYLKKKYEFPYVHFLATLSAIYVIIFLIGTFTGLVSIFSIWYLYGIFNLFIFLIFLGFFLFLLGIVIFSPKFPESKNKWINRFVKVINGWHLIKNNKRVIFTVGIISLIQLILGAIGTIVSYHIIGIEISFFKALFIASIGSISILLAITPGNLGIGDAISIFSASIIGVGLTEAVGATIISRAVNLIIIFIIGPIFSYILLKHKPKLNNKAKDL